MWTRVARLSLGIAERLPDEPTIRAGVGQADTKTIYEVWKMMRRAEVDRGPLPDELHAQRTAMSTERIARFLPEPSGRISGWSAPRVEPIAG